MIRSHSAIAKHYIFHGWFLIDFVATFPFQYFTKDYAVFVRLFRLFRLPKLIQLIDLSKVNRLLKSFFETSERQNRVKAQYMLVNVYRVFRMVIQVIVINYFVGLLLYLISLYLNPDDVRQDFITAFGLEEENKDISNFDRVIVACYYAMTTLSTVGYGDFYPKSALEVAVSIFVMLCGVAFFSYLMGSFIDIITTYNEKIGKPDESIDLHSWMNLLTRFTNNKPLPKNLITQIDNHFEHYWKKDRLGYLSRDDEYLNALPRSIKRLIMVHYLFDDVFYQFRLFFDTQKNWDSKFLYDIAFGFKPRNFIASRDTRLIYDEEEVVSEMYFIMKGEVGIGFYRLSQGLSKSQYQVGVKMPEKSYICEYYAIHNKKSEFIYLATKDVEAFALSKRFLLNHIFPKYPEIEAEMKEKSLHRYKLVIKNKLQQLKEDHILEMNKRNTYHSLNLREKDSNEINQG